MRTMRQLWTRVWIHGVMVALVAGGISLSQQSKGVGVSLSYFYPRNGYMASPIMPISVKDLGFRFGVVGFNSSLALFSMGGMPVKGMEGVKIDDPIIGPFHSLVATATPQLIIPVKSFEFRLSAGGFGFYNFNKGLLYGNLDRELAKKEGWDAVNSSFDYENNFGMGWVFGGSVTYMIIKNTLGVTVGANYYRGSSDLNLHGFYVGGSQGGNLVKKTVNYPESKLDYRGVEVMVGISLFSGKGSNDEGKHK